MRCLRLVRISALRRPSAQPTVFTQRPHADLRRGVLGCLGVAPRAVQGRDLMDLRIAGGGAGRHLGVPHPCPAPGPSIGSVLA